VCLGAGSVIRADLRQEVTSRDRIEEMVERLGISDRTKDTHRLLQRVRFECAATVIQVISPLPYLPLMVTV
jgi:hypothetical protein